ncbi:unnamed protein product [Cuscuta campestris]|uniref:RNase H type-1 domain-containing protein n=1 Tax=Cuscuta campestris TaxID=132261 RepID=A0A484LIH8_9ASTE|nr:unnamed protein product [Cuscuta campestris]
MNNTASALVQVASEGVTISLVVTQRANSAHVMSMGLSPIPTPSMAAPFAVPVPFAGLRVTFPQSMTQFLNDPANLQAIQGFGQNDATASPNGVVSLLDSSSTAITFLTTDGQRCGPYQLDRCTQRRWSIMPSSECSPSQSTPQDHCVSVESDDGEWDIPRAHRKKKGKTLRPATSCDSALKGWGKGMMVKSDSSLIVGQVTGNMEAREGRLAQYKDLALALLKGFAEFKIAQIHRAENADADLLSKLTQSTPEHVSKISWNSGFHVWLHSCNAPIRVGTMTLEPDVLPRANLGCKPVFQEIQR